MLFFRALALSKRNLSNRKMGASPTYLHCTRFKVWLAELIACRALSWQSKLYERKNIRLDRVMLETSGFLASCCVGWH